MARTPGVPTYSELMLPVLRAVQQLGGSASNREINMTVIEQEGFSDEQLQITYPDRTDGPSVIWDRIDWARSYCKLSGMLDSPRRGLFLLTGAGRDVLALDEPAARARLAELDRWVRNSRPKKRPTTSADGMVDTGPADEALVAAEVEAEVGTSWKQLLLHRMHQLSPDAFEELALYVLRQYGLELTRRGGTGDEGIDGIGTAPLSEVFSATVAVQAKRYDPTSTVGRETVALFQRDAGAVGAERCVLVTLGRFSAPARKAAVSVTPRVDLIDGDRLCELMLAKGIGVSLQPVVDEPWFTRFHTAL